MRRVRGAKRSSNFPPLTYMRPISTDGAANRLASMKTMWFLCVGLLDSPVDVTAIMQTTRGSLRISCSPALVRSGSTPLSSERTRPKRSTKS